MHVVTIIATNFLPRAAVLARTHPRAQPPTTRSRSSWSTPSPASSPDDGHLQRRHPGRPAARRRRVRADGADLRRHRAVHGAQALGARARSWTEAPRSRPISTPTSRSTRSLDEIEKLSLEHGIVLTPHTVEPIPRDGLAPPRPHIMAGRHLQPRLPRRGPGLPADAEVVAGAAAPRLRHRAERDALRRPALDRPGARLLPARRAHRPDLQRGLLEPRLPPAGARPAARSTSRATVRCTSSTSAATSRPVPGCSAATTSSGRGSS